MPLVGAGLTRLEEDESGCRKGRRSSDGSGEVRSIRDEQCPVAQGLSSPA